MLDAIECVACLLCTTTLKVWRGFLSHFYTSFCKVQGSNSKTTDLHYYTNRLINFAMLHESLYNHDASSNKTNKKKDLMS